MASRKLLLVVLTSLFFNICNAQTVEEIVSDRATYIWGKGKGATLKKADNDALSMLINQISTTVESKFDWIRIENEDELKEKVNSVVNTYSNATLHNTERIVISNEPDAEIFRYIKRADVEKVFEQRKDKILDFISSARKAETENRIADALRYYYWSLILLKSHPDCNDIEFTTKAGKQKILISWIPAKMNEIFSKISFKVSDITTQEEYKTILIHIYYHNKPAVNFDYSYWDGRDWSNVFSAKNGEGLLEFFGVNAENKTSVDIKAEYMFDSQTHYDNELKQVMDNIEAISFPGSYYTIRLSEPGQQLPTPKLHVKTDLVEVENTKDYTGVITPIVEAIKQKDFESVKHYFTKDGYDMFTKLINYGNAKVIGYFPELKVYALHDAYMCRHVRMSFHFENNIRKFVEDVIFHFNKDHKIESISFGLSHTAVKSIMENNTWRQTDRLILINFLEHFKTAYALERLDYIESIFADDALIITGYVVTVKQGLENRYKDNQIVKYNRYSKREYIQHLNNCFRSKEFINIKFEESDIRKGGKGGNVYGVQIKQNYYSSNYGDKGYLFLMVDLNDPDQPVIHVRTWQPHKALDGSIYDLSDF